MKVIKNINNNVAQCLDSKGREVIVFGKGVGFYKQNEEIPLSNINRTFYNIKDTDFGVIRNIPTVVINTAIYIIDRVSEQLNVVYPSSAAISLADHLQFAIERKDKNIYLPQPIIQDLYQLYPEEMEAALDSLRIIEKMTGVKLPKQEAGTLAMHFVNDRVQYQEEETIDTLKYIDQATELIEKEYAISLDRNSFNYRRFVTHLDYLIRRLADDDQIFSVNENLIEEIRTKYPQSYDCAKKISLLFKEDFKKELNRDELLYISVHINRMVSRAEE